MKISARAVRPAALMLALLLSHVAPPAAAQDAGPVQEPIAAQVYKDPRGRFGLTAPAGWARLADSSPDEVTFQNNRGDNIRVTISPLKVSMEAFLANYVDTYLEVLAQSFTDVKFLGERTTVVASREASDFTFSAVYGTTPVLCRQVLIFGSDHVLYLTFAGYGSEREIAEQLFHIALLTLWVDPAFGGLSIAKPPSEMGEWPFDLQLPGGWTEYQAPAGGTRIFRPANARPMSAMITTFVNKPSKGLPETVDDQFVKIYAERVCAYYSPAPCQITKTSRTTLGGAPAVRFDYQFAAETNMRRVALVLAMHKGQVVGVACEAAETAYPTYDKAFETSIASLRFK
jgi:hypothetical protein